MGLDGQVFMVYFILGCSIDFAYGDWRLFYVPQVFEGPAETGW